MKTRILFGMTLLVAGVLSYSFVGNESKGYEYVTLLQVDGVLFVSGTSTEYKREKIEVETSFDFSKTLQRVQQLESQGWELVENTVAGEGGSRNYFLLRKAKE